MFDKTPTRSHSCDLSEVLRPRSGLGSRQTRIGEAVPKGRIYPGVAAFVAAGIGAIGAYQCFSVYNGEKTPLRLGAGTR